MSTQPTINSTEYEIYDQISNLFIDSLLSMNHVSPSVHLNGYFFELILFTHPESHIYLSSENNEYYILNTRKKFKSVLTATTVFYCDIYKKKGRKLDSMSFVCNEKYFYFLRNTLGKKKTEDGKYYCDVKCLDLFSHIVNKLEILDFKYNDYIRMEEEFKTLNEKINDIPQQQRDIEEKIISLKLLINKTDVVSEENNRTNLDKLNELSKDLIEIKDVIARHKELKNKIVPDNIRKVKNIKSFIDSFSKIKQSQLLIVVSPSAPVIPDEIKYDADHCVKSNVTLL